MFKVKVVFIPDNAESSTCAHRYGLFSSSNPRFQFQVTPQEIWAIMCGVVAAWWWILLSIHIIWIPGASTDSTTAQQFGMMPSSNPGFQPTPPICTNSCSGSGRVMGCSAHPHHIKVVKHLAYVWNWCENHAMWVCSFNRSSMVWFNAQKQLRISAAFSNLGHHVWW